MVIEDDHNGTCSKTSMTTMVTKDDQNGHISCPNWSRGFRFLLREEKGTTMKEENVKTIDNLMAYALERDISRLAALEANKVYLKALPGVDWRLIREKRERNGKNERI